MQLGIVGLGRMGANMARRLMEAGHECVVNNRSPGPIDTLVGEGATGAYDLQTLVDRLDAPRHIWIMVPAGVVDSMIDQLVPLLSEGDTLIDGGNSRYHDDIHRGEALEKHGINYLDVGTSGGVWGYERGYCMMIGGQREAVDQLSPIFDALAPGVDAAGRTPGRTEGGGPEGSTAERGWLHCGPHGAGHFVKMVHNGIEYGLMAAYAEGFNILADADVGAADRTIDAETAPMENPEYYRYDLDLAEIAEVWRRGSVISSWLLDLTAHAMLEDPDLAGYAGRVSDSGEGRWTLQAAIDQGVPAPVLSSALFSRFSSRGNGTFANKVLSAMRSEFGGHAEKPAGDAGE